MANFDSMIPFILYWEVSYKGSAVPQIAYKEAAKKGYHCVKGDKGGPTMCGVTIATYKSYCRSRGLPLPGIEQLRNLPYAHWHDIAKSMFWDKCKADLISSDPIAWVIVDWTWTAGTNAIKAAQRALSLTADGIIGPKTITALNAGDHRSVFNKLQAAREAYYRRIAVGTNAKFLRGWLNRTKSITFTSLNF